MPRTSTLDPDAVIGALKGDAAVQHPFPLHPQQSRPAPRSTRQTILRIADSLPDVLMLADEAYLEFSDTPSLAAEAVARSNLLVLKTLSKAFALAGARVGGLVGPAETLELVARALPPYPLPTLSIAAALEALAAGPPRGASWPYRELLAERERITPLIAASPYVRQLYPSAGNFLFLETDDTEQLAARLAADGIRVRYRPQGRSGRHPPDHRHPRRRMTPRLPRSG